MKNRMQAGFTLVELIVVIVILGILAAVALPKFMGLEREARVAAVRSMGGTMLSAANMAHGLCMAQNCANGAVIQINGKPITFLQGYPNNASIRDLLQSYEGFNTNAAGNQMIKLGGANASCFVTYNQPAAAGAAPRITYQGGAEITSKATEDAVLANLRIAC
ncbi:MAG TPA: type II secretion system protein [Steroidobacteraceae bacterium]|nr:type II secretion system protein [Steroidobacteraceae bacterium]